MPLSPEILTGKAGSVNELYTASDDLGRHTTMLSIKETAALFKMSDYSIRKGIRERKLPAVQLSGKRGQYLIDPECFRDALREMCANNICRASETDNAEHSGNVVNFNNKIRRIQG